jgi:hypothetical protein
LLSDSVKISSFVRQDKISFVFSQGKKKSFPDCATSALKKWFAGLLLPKTANWLSTIQNTILPMPAFRTENPFLLLFLRKLVAIFLLFLLFLLSPLFFPSQLIRKTLSVTKTQSGRHNIYRWREGWYRALPPPLPREKENFAEVYYLYFLSVSLCYFPGCTPPHTAAPIMYSFRSVILLSL